jgi:L-iditol 2-dehydrogenase
MEDTMRALILTKNQEIELRTTFPIPQIKEGFVLVKVKRAGICASDIGYWKHGGANLQLPVILGHEVSGIIVDAGDTSFSKGSRVFLTNDFYLCGECRFCKSGNNNMCIGRRSIGSKENGGFAEYILAPKGIVRIIPEGMSFEEAAYLEVLACGVHAIVNQAKVKVNDLVFVSGPGAIGLSAALTAKAMGCRVVLGGLSQDIHRLQIAQGLGIDYVVDISQENLAEIIHDLSDGYGADITVEAAGVYPSLQTCFELTRKRGTCVEMGVLHGTSTIDLSVVMFKELIFTGSYAKNERDWIIARDLVALNRVEVGPMISDIMSLEDYEKAFDKSIRTDCFKIMFDPELRN